MQFCDHPADFIPIEFAVAVHFLSNVERLIFVRLQNSPMVSPCSTILPLRTFLFTFATSIDAFVGYVIVQPIVKDTACPGKSQAHMAKNFALLRNL